MEIIRAYDRVKIDQAKIEELIKQHVMVETGRTVCGIELHLSNTGEVRHCTVHLDHRD